MLFVVDRTAWTHTIMTEKIEPNVENESKNEAEEFNDDFFETIDRKSVHIFLLKMLLSVPLNQGSKSLQ